MTDLFDEVGEDLKEERRNYIIQKVTRFFITASIIVVVGVSVYVWKERGINELQNKLGEWFNQGLHAAENNKLDDSVIFFDKMIEHSHQQYTALAYFNKAAILLKQDKFEEAQKTLLELSEQKHFDLAIRELAQLTLLANQLNSNKPELSNTEETLIRLTKENKPWRISGLQLKALYDIKNHKFAEAKADLNEILSSKQATKVSYDIATSIMASIPKAE